MERSVPLKSEKRFVRVVVCDRCGAYISKYDNIKVDGWDCCPECFHELQERIREGE